MEVCVGCPSEKVYFGAHRRAPLRHFSLQEHAALLFCLATHSEEVSKLWVLPATPHENYWSG